MTEDQYINIVAALIPTTKSPAEVIALADFFRGEIEDRFTVPVEQLDAADSFVSPDANLDYPVMKMG
jgi:hypothetical protein